MKLQKLKKNYLLGLAIHLITPYTHIGSIPGGRLFRRSSRQVTTSHGLHPTSALRLPIHTNRWAVKTTGGKLHINHNQHKQFNISESN